MREEKQTQVLTVQAFKDINEREGEELLSNPLLLKYPHFHLFVDRTRTHLNFEITRGTHVAPVDSHRSISGRVKELLKRENIKDPNEGLDKPRYRTVANIIIGGSWESMNALAFYKQHVNKEKGADNSNIKRIPGIENWAKEMYNFFAKKYGEKYIVAFIVHLDVNNPYANCIVIPVVENDKGDKKISWKKTFVGGEGKIADFKKSMSKLMDELAKVNLKYGLLRGESFHTK